MKSSNANSTPLLLTALIVAVLGAAYYFLIMPKMDEVDMLKSQVASTQANIASIQQQIDVLASAQTDVVENEFAMRKKLPSKRNIEQLLRNIEEMEYVTGTRLTSVSFNNYDALVSGSGLTDPNMVPAPETTETPAPAPETTPEATPAPDPNATTTEPTTTEQTEATPPALPVSTIDVLTLPPNLKMITFNLEVEAPNPDALLAFLKEIEKLERIMNVESINFALQGEEMTYTPDMSEVVSVSVQVTTFYYE